MEYEKILDETFAKGRLWKHRTFRTVLDPLSHEYSNTTMEQKVQFIEELVKNNVNLRRFINNYKSSYIEQNRRDIAIETEKALIYLLEYMLKDQKGAKKYI